MFAHVPDKMWCFVTLPNAVVLEIEVDGKAPGQECLDKVCEKLGIIEVDYFGLQYGGNKGEQLWLNMRNRISRQLAGQPPYRLRLRVKFFVQPHFLLQEATRDLFYQQTKQEFIEGQLNVTDRSLAASIVAHIAQSECGDCNHSDENTGLCISHRTLMPRQYVDDVDFMSQVKAEQRDLHRLSSASAKYRMLQLISSLDCYGVEYHQVKNAEGQSFHMGVGPEGIALYDTNNQLVRSIAYPTIQMATHASKCLFLHTIRDNGTSMIFEFKLVSQKAANGLYRCVTEMHSFYRCDTVRNAVSSQFSRDLKGTLASLFNENTTLGKKYIFDIRRTCREAYDHARRVLYTTGNSTSLPSSPVHSCERCHSTSMEDGEADSCSSQECQIMKEKLERLQDALLCRVCMDAEINTAFCPCGHLVCCAECSKRIDTCPLCRSPIKQTQYIFLPTLHDKNSFAMAAKLLPAMEGRDLLPLETNWLPMVGEAEAMAVDEELTLDTNLPPLLPVMHQLSLDQDQSPQRELQDPRS